MAVLTARASLYSPLSWVAWSISSRAERTDKTERHIRSDTRDQQRQSAVEKAPPIELEAIKGPQPDWEKDDGHHNG
jgi:hypothetical protein